MAQTMCTASFGPGIVVVALKIPSIELEHEYYLYMTFTIKKKHE